MNPVVSVADALQGGLPWSETLQYVFAQLTGGIAGTILAHAMFALPLISLSHHVRSGSAQFLSECVATFGLLSVIWGCARSRAGAVPFAVASYITAAYWFTASTSFANPAATIARSLSDTFAGIRPADVPLFVVAQFTGGLAATLLFRRLVPTKPV
jgi:glycerol uptake facilitator-like aquaporin